MPDSPQDDLLSSVLSAAPLGAGIHGNPPFCRARQSGTSGHRRAAVHFGGIGNGWPHTRASAAPELIEYRCDWRFQTIADLAGTAATPHRARAGDAATARFLNGALNPFNGGPEPRQQGYPVS
jgi:hypothetical protein